MKTFKKFLEEAGKKFGKDSKINPKVLERPETVDKNRDNTNPIIKKIKE